MNKYFFIVFVCFLVKVSQSQTKTELIKIVADDRAKRDQFGWSTAIFGNYFVTGTPCKKAKDIKANTLLNDGGAAYVFKKDSSGNWTQSQLLFADNPKMLDFFGGSVSMYDNYLAIGADGDNNGTMDNNKTDIRQGAVYIYKLDKSGNYIPTQKITLDYRGKYDCFGLGISLNKKELAISAPGKTFPNPEITGAVYVYELNSLSGWIIKDTLICPEKNILHFGSEIYISDSLLIVGTFNAEKVFIYKLTKNKKWILIKKLNSSDNSDINFGSSVLIHDNIICVGATGSYGIENRTSTDRQKKRLGAGSVSIYEIDSINNITFKQRITAKDIKAEMHFGQSMSMTDSLLVIGAFGDPLDIENLSNNMYAGAVYIFKKNTEGYFVETKKIVSLIRSVWDKFGFSVSAHKKNVVIGSRFEKEDVQEKNTILDAGAVYIYEDK